MRLTLKNIIYTDENGEWANYTYFGVSDTHILANHKDKVRTLTARGFNNLPAVLYNIQDARAYLSQLRSLPQVNPKSNKYVDEDGEWASRAFFGSKDIQRIVMKRDNIRTKEGRGANRGLSLLYNIQDVNQVLERSRRLPQVDPQTKVFVNEGGEWGSKAYFGKRDCQYLNRHNEQIRTIRGRGPIGQIATLYNIQDAQLLLAQSRNLPQVDPATHIYTDKDGEQWCGRKALGNTDYMLIQKRKDQIRSIEGRNTTSAKVTLYNLKDVRKIVNEIRTKKEIDIAISPDEADEMMGRLEIEQ